MVPEKAHRKSGVYGALVHFSQRISTLIACASGFTLGGGVSREKERGPFQWGLKQKTIAQAVVLEETQSQQTASSAWGLCRCASKKAMWGWASL